MKKTAAAIVTLLIITVAAVVLPAKAETRTIIVPDDYPTIQSAIDAASTGDTVFVRKGTYKEPTLRINKALSLIGEDAVTTRITLNPPWIEYENPVPFDWNQIPHYDDAVKIEANDVKLSGFTIICNVSKIGGDCSATGERTQVIGNIIWSSEFLLRGSDQVFAQNTIRSIVSCYGSGCKTIAGNRIVGGSILIGARDTSTPDEEVEAVIYGNTVTDSGSASAGYGIRIDGGSNAVFNNTTVNCTHAISVLGESSSNSIYANTIVNNIEGLELFGQGSNNTFHSNHITNNQYGILMSHTYLRTPGENNTVYRNNFVGNTKQVNTDTTYPGNYDSPVPTFHIGSFDNGKEGNYWSDYGGADSDSDGVGDTPYIIDSSRRDNYPQMIPLDISTVNLELPEWAYLLPHPLPAPLPLPVLEDTPSEETTPTTETTPPEIKFLPSTNQTYNQSNVQFVFTLNEPSNWTGYSIDGEENVTVTGNFTLIDLSNGLHNLTVYANDTFGNMGVSETISFIIDFPEPKPDPFPVLPIAATSTASAVLIGVGLLVYLKKRK